MLLDASEFLRKHPWPGRAISDTFDDDTHRKRKWSKKFWSTMKIVCGKTGVEEETWDEDEREDERVLFDATENVSTVDNVTTVAGRITVVRAVAGQLDGDAGAYGSASNAAAPTVE